MAMTKSGALLEKVGIARYREMFTRLSGKNREKLTQLGIFPEKDKWLSGFNKGTLNILNKNKFNPLHESELVNHPDIQKRIRNNIPCVDVKSRSIVYSGVPLGSQVQNNQTTHENMLNALGARHEAYEVTNINKDIPQIRISSPVKRNGFETHHGLGVLINEHRDISRFPDDGIIDTMKNSRKFTGEYPLLTSLAKRKYNDYLKTFTNTEKRKIKRAKPDNYISGMPNYVPWLHW